MRLSSIHIKGFKSFPLDTTIHFNERVTGVVGPNGSGKSNIVDAIRWVLGEQKTTELRLDAMSDVLFNGTSKRKKSGLAQVTLNFSNTKNLIPTEYSQVSISRLLFRSGESEYRINDVPCRLKDIRSLFADTGVGSDSYAIIALHMVDDILTDNDGSRRRMFEQASGISKYKKRKKETLNKLKNTNADLDRVEDLLFEIGNNLQELEKQARRVERFLKIKDQYKKITIELNLRQFDDISVNRTRLLGQIQEETDKHRSSETKLRNIEAQLQEERKKIISDEHELGMFQKEINELLDSIRRLENEKQLNRQKIEFDKQKIDSIGTRQIDLGDSISQLERRFQELQNSLKSETKIRENLTAEFDAATDHYESAKKQYELLKADHDAINLEKQQLEEKRFQYEKRIAVSENQIERLKQNELRGESGLKDLSANRDALKKSIIQKKALLDSLNGKYQSLKSSEESRLIKIKELQEEKESLRQEKLKVDRKLDAKSNEFDLVKSMIDSLEGFPESIKFLDKSWKVNAALLTDLVYAPEGFKLAIEGFLEPYLNYYVVEDQEDAYDAISLLHGSQKGKANFFILEKINSNPPVTFEKEGFVRALDVLEFEEKFYNLFAHLLHNVYITNLDYRDIEMVSGEFGEDNFTILDKSGAYTANQLSITGGSIGLFEGKKLGRKKNLEKLQQEIQALQKKTRTHDQSLVKIKDRINKLESDNDSYNLENIRGEIDREKLEIIEQEVRLAGFDKQFKQISEQQSQYAIERDELVKTVKDAGDAISGITIELDLLLRGSRKDDHSLQTLSDQLSRASETRNKQNIELIKHQNLLDSLENDSAYTQKDLEKSRNQLAINDTELKVLQENLIRLEDQLVNMEKDLVVRYEDKKKREEKLSDVERAFYSKRGIITELEEQISQIRRAIHQSQFLINELKEKLHDQDFRLQSVTERLRIEFDLAIEDLADFERSEMALVDLETKHDRLKRKIENFGEINTMAIEAFNEMKLRFETIEKQKEDIIESQETLMKTIQEIETIATQRYLETFEVVKEYFKEVFTSLFKSGDTCDILMDDPENPLESKIEIIAKPKGKRPKTLNQLSGGEKTLTAIALLFSLYLYKPAPFCIFDEVDAPLDDANIEKFNRIVKKFSKESQFIIITHNKATMAAVDVLYGVFMQEMGVSEVAAVDFRNYEQVPTLVNAN